MESPITDPEHIWDAWHVQTLTVSISFRCIHFHRGSEKCIFGNAHWIAVRFFSTRTVSPEDCNLASKSSLFYRWHPHSSSLHGGTHGGSLRPCGAWRDGFSTISPSFHLVYTCPITRCTTGSSFSIEKSSTSGGRSGVSVRYSTLFRGMGHFLICQS